MPKRKLSEQEKRSAVDMKRAKIRASGQTEIIPNLVADDESDESGRPIVREATTGRRPPAKRVINVRP